MKIVCIAASDIPSSKANSIQVMKACQALAQLGHEVRLLVPGRAAADRAALADLYGLSTPFPIEWLPANPRLKRYDFCWAAVRRARALRADAVCVWPLQAAVFAAFWGLPTLLELHGPPEGALGPWLFRLFLALPGKKRLLPISQALLNLLDALFHVSQFSYSISPNGVELDRYADLPQPMAARQALGLVEAPTVGYTGHLYPGRGTDLMVSLAQRLAQVQFLWVGGNPQDVASWRERFESLGIRNITLSGFIENGRLPRYQSAADVLIMPYERVITGSSGGNSAAYCSPMKMFEYMACRRAIVSSDLTVIHEVLNEKNAVLCPPEDVDAWVQALSGLLADPPRRAALAEQARRDAEQFTWLQRARRATEGLVG